MSLQLLRDMETNGNDNGREGRSCDKSLSDDTLLRMMENLGVPPERRARNLELFNASPTLTRRSSEIVQRTIRRLSYLNCNLSYDSEKC